MRPEGTFFVAHKNGFAPLYALLAVQGETLGLGFMLLGAIIYGLLALLYWNILTTSQSQPMLIMALWRSRVHWATLAAVWIALLWAYPLLSDDVIYYLTQARLLIHYGVNPYTPESAQFLAGDSWYTRLSPIHFQTTSLHYGPMWLLISLPAVVIGGSSLAVSLFVLKIINGLLLMGCAAVAMHIVPKHLPVERRLVVLALVWNPWIWMEVLWNAHNDLAMVLCLLLVVLAFQQKRIVLAFSILMCGVATKYVPVLCAPLLLAATIRHFRRQHQPWVKTIVLAAGSAALTLLALYLPILWNADGNILTGLTIQSQRINPSFGALIQVYSTSLVGETGARLLIPILLVSVIAWQTWRTWSGIPIIETMLIVLLTYGLILGTWFVPWYALWPLLLGLVARPQLRTAMLGATLLLPAYYIINLVTFPSWLSVLLIPGMPLLLMYLRGRAVALHANKLQVGGHI